MKSLFVVFFCVAAASAFDIGSFLTSLGSEIPAQFQPQVTAINGVIQSIEQHQSPVQIAQKVLALNIQDDVASLCQVSFLQTVAPVQKACSVVVPALDKAASLASSFLPAQRIKRSFNFGSFVSNLFTNGPLSNIPQLVTSVTQLADKIKDHASPSDIIGAVASLNLTDSIASICNIQAIQGFAPVQKVCPLVQQYLPQADNLLQAAPALLSGGLSSLGRYKRFDVSGLISSLFSNGGLLSNIPQLVTSITQLAEQIKDKSSPSDIISAVVSLNLQDKIASVCNIPQIANLAPAQKVCPLVKQYLPQIDNLAQSAPALLSGGLASLG